MAFVKVIKNRSYFKRFQVKFKRRRQGKTNYHVRKRLIVQAKNKYNTPKYRLIVRLTNKDVLAQVAYARIEGDYIIAAAYSHELGRYGIKVGLTNFASCYSTGLLLARRLLHKLNLGDVFVGQTKPDGQMYSVDDSGQKPFRCYLDSGLAQATTGAKIFGVMKGAVDGGLDIPHSEKRFPGYDKDTKQFDPEGLRSRIFAKHVSNYMKDLIENDEDAYKIQFSRYIKHGITPDEIEELYKKAHEAIRRDPAPAPKKTYQKSKKRWNLRKATFEERQAKIKKAKEAWLAKIETGEASLADII